MMYMCFVIGCNSELKQSNDDYTQGLATIKFSWKVYSIEVARVERIDDRKHLDRLRFSLGYPGSVNKFKFTVVYKIRITAELTSIREVAALFGPTRNAYKDSCLSDNAAL